MTTSSDLRQVSVKGGKTVILLDSDNARAHPEITIAPDLRVHSNSLADLDENPDEVRD